MTYQRVLVSPAFRGAALEILPGLANHIGNWRLLGILIFRAQSGYTRGMKLFLPHDLILDCYEDRSHRKAAYDYISEFSTEVFPVQVTAWAYGQAWKQDEPRSVESMLPPPPLMALVRAELKTSPSELVYLDDGGAITERTIKEDTERLLDESTRAANARFGAHLDHAATVVLDYLNQLPPNRFKKILGHLDDARHVADMLSEPSKTQQLGLLRQIKVRPKPIYGPSERSTRIYGVGASFLQLQSDVRDALLKDWEKLDLASCHLAVAAATWGGGLPVTMAFLEARRSNPDQPSLWKILADHMGVTLNGETKSTLKEALYSLVYGMGEESLMEHFVNEMPESKGGFKHFVKQPFIAECWQQRRAELQNLKAAGFGIDCFGDKIVPPKYESGEDNWRSVLAVRSQSFELALLLPVYELAKSLRRGHGFRIMFHLHDGIGVVADRRSETDIWVRRITELVDHQAARLEIPTWLERQS